ncbi:MAG: dipeptide epimerase [Fidelibacterota bacterium]|nr:MAG: dipeptide epimerase [Candidatus Neomarinimicrobiota bacterium]
MRLSYEVKRLQLKHTWTIARGSSDFKDNVIVTLEGSGVTGLGEAAPNIRYDETPESTIAVIEKAKPLFEKQDPWEFVELGFAIQALDPAQTAAKAALDMVLMDWITKSLGVPLYQYLGLAKAKAPTTSLSIGIDTAEVIQQKVREASEFPILKIKVGMENEEEIIGAVRAVTDKSLIVDANEGWKDKQEALERIEWLISQGVQLVEQPMPADMLDETRWLRERTSVPIIADESVKTAGDIPLLSLAFDGINIKLMKAGGLQEALRMVWLAKSLGMKVMLGCMVETSVAISAAAGISPLADYADLDGNLLISNDPYLGVSVDNGQLILNDDPGIGVKPRGRCSVSG